MIQDCFITALMQESSFKFDTPLKNDSFLLNVSQTNIVHFYEPEVLSNMISSSTTTLCVCVVFTCKFTEHNSQNQSF